MDPEELYGISFLAIIYLYQDDTCRARFVPYCMSFVPFVHTYLKNAKIGGGGQ
jgi:hypothetical protein